MTTYEKLGISWSQWNAANSMQRVLWQIQAGTAKQPAGSGTSYQQMSIKWADWNAASEDDRTTVKNYVYHGKEKYYRLYGSGAPVTVSRADKLTFIENTQNTNEMPIGALIATSLSLAASSDAIQNSVSGLLSGGDGFFSAEARAERKATRQDKREAIKYWMGQGFSRREARKKWKSGESATVVVNGSSRTVSSGSGVASGTVPEDSFSSRVTSFIEENWVWIVLPAGVILLVLIFVLVLKKKKKKEALKRRLAKARAARRRNVLAPSKGTRRRTAVKRVRSQSDIKAERLRNLAKARAALRRKRK